MESTLKDFDNIELALPANAAYVTAARQTAFSIAGRLGFDAEESDDIKTAVSEACAYILKKLAGGGALTYRIIFYVSSDHIHIRLSCPSADSADHPEGDYSLLLIKNLMDHMDILDGDGLFEIVMSKRHIEGFTEE